MNYFRTKNNMIYPVKTPKWTQWLLPNFRWSYKKETATETVPKTLYLTFDDGPQPEITDWVLTQLAAYDAKATFFCIGANVVKHPDLYQQVLSAGHAVGNHTFHHLNGWVTPNDRYLSDVEACQKVVKSNLFRPPYGRISWRQANLVRAAGFQIVLWEVICGDFDPQLSPQQALDNVLQNAQDGSVLVFHDSVKAFRILKVILPKILAHFSSQGFVFKTCF